MRMRRVVVEAAAALRPFWLRHVPPLGLSTTGPYASPRTWVTVADGAGVEQRA